MRLRGERDLLNETLRVAAPARDSALLVLAAAVLWGTSGSSQELLGGAVNPLVVGALRTIVGGAVLLAVAMLAARGDALPTLARAEARVPLLIAGVCIALYQVTFFFGVQLLGIAVGTIVAIAATPFAASLVSVALGQGRPTRVWFGSTSLAVIGLVLLVRPEGDAMVSVAGVAAALTAGLSFGTFTVLTKGLLARGLRRLETVAFPFVVAGVLLTPALVIGLVRSDDPAAVIRAPGVFVVLWLAVAATALGYVLFAAGLGGVSAVTGVTLVLAEPLTATLLGVLVFAERLGPPAVVGASLVAVALLVTAVRPDIEPAR